MSASPYIVGPATDHSHTHTIILLHGRGSEAQEFASEFFESEVSGPETDRTLPALFPTIRWVFPQAKILRSERFNMEMSQWFDMWSVEDPQERVELQIPGLQSSVDLIINLIKQEELLVPRKKIFLGGISQGFATAIAVFFADGNGGFAGLCGFSSWLPLADQASSEILKGGSGQRPGQRLAALQRLYLHGGSRQQEPSSLLQMISTPILLEHCHDDKIITIQNGTRLRNSLRQLSLSVDWNRYMDGGHWVNEPLGVNDLVHFLRRYMSEAAT